jgi:phenylpyruvate tautomerase PptA (4-oxalocrotonate tautomerase family)
MPWINVTLPSGALEKDQQEWLMAHLTKALMFWEKVPNTPEARRFMKGWVYEVSPRHDYVAGLPADRPSYFVEVRIPSGRLDPLAKQGIQRDFTTLILRAEGGPDTVERARRIWITINEIDAEDWSIGGHTDWIRSYTSALDETDAYPLIDESSGRS